MDLASVVAALASVGVRVSGSTPNSSVQVDSSRACPTGLAGPEPPAPSTTQGSTFTPEVMSQDQRAREVKVLPWVVEGAGGLGAGKTSGAGTRGVSLDVVIGGRTGYSNTNGGEEQRQQKQGPC